ncbi:MAG: 3-methyl-2-oxobutanoate hydroxymethyltransferase [Candidatus Limnocylindrales bacterium]
MSATTQERRLTIADIAKSYREGRRIVAITAYDYPTARIVDASGIPLILVGDSLGMVMLGYDSTVRVSIEEMLHHTKAVVRGTKRAIVVGDMPFLTYGISAEESVANAGRFLHEAGAQAVKIEGGTRSARAIEAMVRNGIAVMAHIGLTPQAVNSLGGYKVQGRDRDSARRLLADAQAVQEAGAFAVVIEAVPTPLATAITERLAIPTIGIGAGTGCSGQIQVITDILGLTADHTPKHARLYGQIGAAMGEALAAYAHDVEEGTFPGEAESFAMDDAILADVLGLGALDQAPSVSPVMAIPLDEDL